MTRDRLTPAAHELAIVAPLHDKIAALAAARSAHARRGGDTLTCDRIHDAIVSLEDAIAIIVGEDECLIDALAWVRDSALGGC